MGSGGGRAPERGGIEIAGWQRGRRQYRPTSRQASCLSRRWQINEHSGPTGEFFLGTDASRVAAPTGSSAAAVYPPRDLYAKKVKHEGESR